MKTSIILHAARFVLSLAVVCASTPSLAQMPELIGGKAQTLAPLVRETTPSVVNISVMAA